MLQLESGHQMLVGAKDKAQAAATWAMSIVHIAVLKLVIDYGKKLPYYIPVLVLVCLAIALQVTAGVLTLIVINIEMFYKQFGDFITDESKRNEYTDENVDKILKALEAGHSDIFSIITHLRPNSEHRIELDGTETVVRNNNSEPDGCCGRNRVDPSYESSLIKWYNIWQVVMTKSQLTNTTLGAEVSALTNKQRKAEAELNEVNIGLATVLQPSTEYDELLEKKEGIEKTIESVKEKLHSKKEALKGSTERKEALIKQGDVLQAYVDTVTRERVYKRIARYQRGINGLLYVIFVFNALITGFGVSSLEGYISPDTTALPPQA